MKQGSFKVKVLSVQSPFSWFIVYGLKDIENRSWKTNYRGKILIHSSGKDRKEISIDDIPEPLLNDYEKYINTDLKDFVSLQKIKYLSDCQKLEKIDNLIDEYSMKNDVFLKAGFIIGSIEIVDCIEKTESIWGNLDKFNWLLEKPEILKEPIKIKGKLGLWEYQM
jgi:hypothetical protein